MEASLLIRLIDQVTAPATKVGMALKKVGEAAGELKRGFNQAIKEGFATENIEAAFAKAEQRLTKARRDMIGAVGMAMAVAAPLKGLAEFEDRLVGFGNTAGIFGDDLKAIEGQLRAIGPTVNKSASEMLDALEYLVGKGIDPSTGLAMLRAVGMTATATKSDVEDMSASGFAAVDNLKVGAEDLQLAFDAMAAAGKRGGFELNGMAKYFPTLTASAQALGMKGVPAVAELSAALQIAMKGAGDESTAANNMRNFLSKLSSPETVKRFKDMGVNLKREFQIAEKNGVSVFEHMLNRIHQLTGGDQFKMGKLFGDQQVLDFLRPLMANMDEFRSIRDAAMTSAGVNAQDFARVMETATANAKAMAIELNNLLSNGSPLLEMFKELSGYLLEAMRTANAFAKDNPELSKFLVKTVAGLLAANVALRTLRFAFGTASLGLIRLATRLLWFDSEGRNIARGWRLIADSVSGVGRAAQTATSRLGGLRNTVRGAIAASWVIPLVFEFIDDMGRSPEERLDQIRKNHEAWKRFEEKVEETSFGQGWQAVKDRANAMLGLEQGQSPAAALGAWLEGQLKALEESREAFGIRARAFGNRLATAIGEGWQEGIKTVKGLIDDLMAFLREKLQPIRDLVKLNFDVTWPEPPAWLNWLIERGRGLVGQVGDAASGRGASATAFGDGGFRAWVSGQSAGGGDFGTMLEGMDRFGAAAADIESGGRAVADGGAKAGAALNDGAVALRQAAAAINTAIRSAGRSGVGAVSSALSSAKTTALHDGVD